MKKHKAVKSFTWTYSVDEVTCDFCDKKLTKDEIKRNEFGDITVKFGKHTNIELEGQICVECFESSVKPKLKEKEVLRL